MFLTDAKFWSVESTKISRISDGHWWASLVVQMVKNLPVIQETRIQSLGQENPLEKGMTTQSSILACRIPWTEEPGELQSMVTKSQTQLSD